MYNILNTLKPADKLLQGREMDLLAAYRLVGSTTQIIKDMRDDKTFEELWSYAVTTLPQSTEAPAIKRKKTISSKLADSTILETTGQRETPTSHNSEQTAMKRLFLEVIDRLTAELERRFGEENNMCLRSILATDPTSDTFLEHDELFPLLELRNTTVDEAEVQVVKRYVASSLPGISTLELLRNPIMSAVPSVCNVLRLALTFGASSAACESSFSLLSRVFTAYRRSMTQTRKSNLVLLAFEKEMTAKLSSEEVRSTVMRKFSTGSRRLCLF